MRFILTALLVACVMSDACSKFLLERPRPCNIAVRCSFAENLVWATDGLKCYVFRNGCFFFSANCQRQNEQKQVLKSLPKEQCQAMCNAVCPEISSPVCATYNGTMRTFQNACLLEKHICVTGELFSLYREGDCATITATRQ